MKSIITLLIFIVASISYSQLNDTSEVIMQVQIIDSNQDIHLILNNNEYHLIVVNDKKVIKDKIEIPALNTPGEIENISIQFINENLGYIYGNTVAYTFYPFILKTIDGGKSWNKILFNKELIQVPLLKDNFFMFDSLKGIAVTNWNSSPNFIYYLTKDGGNSWEKKSVKMKDKSIRILNSENFTNSFYSKSGEITILIKNPNFENNETKKLVIIRSDDFGENFRILE